MGQADTAHSSYPPYGNHLPRTTPSCVGSPRYVWPRAATCSTLPLCMLQPPYPHSKPCSHLGTPPLLPPCTGHTEPAPPGAPRKAAASTGGNPSPGPKSSARPRRKGDFTLLVLFLGRHLQQQLSGRVFPWCFLHKHPAAAPSFGISPCWLISPSHVGLFFLPCRCLASPGRLFPGREHGRQHLWQLRQRQPRALREMRQEVGAVLAPVGATSPPPAPTAPCRPPL